MVSIRRAVWSAAPASAPRATRNSSSSPSNASIASASAVRTPDHLTARDERTPETVVHLVERMGRPLDEAVEWIGQRGVCREPHGLRAPHDRLQSRMVCGGEAHPEHLGRETLHGERPQLAISQHEQRGRVARDHGTDDREKPLIPIGRADALGQIDRELLQGRPRVHR
jgi:hypothetical protein